MHGGSSGCPVASATSSATLWLCCTGRPVHEWAILCVSKLELHNCRCWFQSANVHFHHIHALCVEVKSKTVKDQNSHLLWFVYVGPHPTSGCLWCHASTTICATPILHTTSQFTTPDSHTKLSPVEMMVLGEKVTY